MVPWSLALALAQSLAPLALPFPWTFALLRQRAAWDWRWEGFQGLEAPAQVTAVHAAWCVRLDLLSMSLRSTDAVPAPTLLCVGTSYSTLGHCQVICLLVTVFYLLHASPALGLA